MTSSSSIQAQSAAANALFYVSKMNEAGQKIEKGGGSIAKDDHPLQKQNSVQEVPIYLRKDTGIALAIFSIGLCILGTCNVPFILASPFVTPFLLILVGLLYIAVIWHQIIEDFHGCEA